MTHEHLNDERLSAYLDGESHEETDETATSDDAVEVQIADCDVCRRRLAALTGARQLMRLPVDPVAPSVKVSAVEEALAGALDAGTRADPTPITTSRRARRRGATLMPVAATAAAVVLVAVGIALGVSHSGSTTAGSAAAPEAASHSTARQSQPEEVPTSAQAGIADLGSIGSVETLKARLVPLVASGSFDKASASGASAPAAGAPQNSTAQMPQFAVTPSPTSEFATCEAAAQRAAGTDEALELVATTTYRTIPALVVVSGPAPSSAGTSRVAIVVARSGCRILGRTTF